jgi:hypothetical protein
VMTLPWQREWSDEPYTTVALEPKSEGSTG